MRIIFKFLVAVFILTVNLAVKYVLFPLLMFLLFFWYIPDIEKWKEIIKEWSKETYDDSYFYEHRDYHITEYYYKTFWDFVKSNKIETEEYKEWENKLRKYR